MNQFGGMGGNMNAVGQPPPGNQTMGGPNVMSGSMPFSTFKPNDKLKQNAMQ